MTNAEIVRLTIINISAWLFIHLFCAWAGTKLPIRAFRPHSLLHKPLPFEKSGLLYERILRIKSWKNFLPDAAGWFKGGFQKRKLGNADPAYLEKFREETVRGEVVHWIVFWAAGLFYFWNPAWVLKWMFLYSAIANLPCIITQRYNRIRIERIQERLNGIQNR